MAEWNYLLDNTHNNINRLDNLDFQNVYIISWINKDNNQTQFNDTINQLVSSGEYKTLDYILVLLLGTHVKLTNLTKLKLIYYNRTIDKATISFVTNYKIDKDGLVKSTHIII